jgi:hypothetical protein
MANRYQEALGFRIRFSAEDDEKAVGFLTDSGDRVMLKLLVLSDPWGNTLQMAKRNANG